MYPPALYLTGPPPRRVGGVLDPDKAPPRSDEKRSAPGSFAILIARRHSEPRASRRDRAMTGPSDLNGGFVASQ